MIGRVALLVTFKKAKPKPQSLSRSHIRDLCAIPPKRNFLTSAANVIKVPERTKIKGEMENCNYLIYNTKI